MKDDAWKDCFQGHVEGSEAELADLYAALSEAAAHDPQAVEEYIKLRDVHNLLRSEFTPAASDEAFVRGVCAAIANKQIKSSVFVQEVVRKNELRRTTAIIKRKRQFGYYFAAAAVLLVVFGIGAALMLNKTSPEIVKKDETRPESPEKMGHIVLLERPGETPAVITILRTASPGAQQESIPARTGEVLYRGDILNTPSVAQNVAVAELVLKDVGSVQVFPATKVDLAAAQSNHVLHLSSGRLLMNVPPLPASKIVSVRTPHALATVLGTRFSLLASADETRLEVYESKVRLQMLGVDGQPTPTESRRVDVTVDSGFSAATSRDGVRVFPLGRETYVAEFIQNVNGYTGAQEVAISNQLAQERGGQGITLFDDDEVLVTILDGKYEKRVLLRFDTLTLPRDAKLESAELELAFENFSGEQRLRGEFMSVPWNGEARGRTGLGWLYSDTGKRWSADGTGLGDWVAGKSFLVSGFQDGLEVRVKIPLDLEQVQNWIQNPASNFGLILIAQDRNKPLRMKTSKNADAKVRPILRLRYTAPTGSQLQTPAKASRPEAF